MRSAPALSAGGNQSLALLNDGTVRQWGETNMAVPSAVTGVTAIATGTNFNLALLGNGTVVPWGINNFGQTNVPTGLANVVAIAAGSHHCLALKSDGTVVSWGDNTYGQATVPSALTNPATANVIGLAAGQAHSMALKNDGTVIAWGDNTYGQTNTITNLTGVKAIAAGAYHSIALEFSPRVQYYPLTAAQDLLLIYNTNSSDSSNVMTYYLANRPMASTANVLGIGCSTNEIMVPGDFTNQVLTPYLNWMTQNPTKRPEYVVLFLDIPSRVEDTNGLSYGSVQYQLFTDTPGAIQPLVTSINMNGTNDCIGYIHKLATNGILIFSNSAVLSASRAGYGNTNYVLDNVRNLNPTNYDASIVSNAINGLLTAGVQTNSIFYLDGYENGITLPHLTNAVNVAGYISWGFHSSLHSNYATNGAIRWSGNSGWWIIRTEESFNGQRAGDGGNFLMWFSSNAFAGTNYSNTPIGGPTYVDEPSSFATDNAILFGLWASGKNLAICCWAARNPFTPPYLQVVGDPFVTR